MTQHRGPETSPPSARPALARAARPPALQGPGADVATLQRLAGNRAVSSLLTDTDQAPGVPAGSAEAAVLARVRPLPAGPGGAPPPGRQVPPPTVQRQGPADAPAPAATLTLGPFVVTSYPQLLSAERFFSSQLTSDAQQLPDGDPARKAAEDLVSQAHSMEPLLQSKGDTPLDQTAVDQANLWYQDFGAARDRIDTAGKAAARAEIERNDRQMADAQAAVESIPDRFADLQRAAFLKKDDELLEKIQKVIGNSLLAASAILDARSKATFMLTKLTAEATHLEEMVEEYEPMVEAAHKVVAAFELLEGAYKLLSPEGATDLDKEMNQAKTALDVAVAATSLIPEMGLYTAYLAILVSVAQECITFITNLARENAHLLNLFYFSTNSLADVDWSAEPGGRPAFDFMLTVMHADNYTQIPRAMPKEVDELFTDREDEFEKGTGEEVPTSGFWFWKSTNEKKIRQWVFNNRQSVWAMLYGSLPVPG